jgi:hypothetical protein
MAPETAELIEKIETERRRARQVADEADKQLVKANRLAKQLARELAKSDVETDEALEILRRAGLLPA